MSAPPTGITSLPPELLQRIFGESSTPTPAGPSNGGPWQLQPLSQQSPMTVSQVSRQWRAIGLDTPRLWQSITVDEDTGPVNPQMVRLWMSRAGCLPRDISFDNSDIARSTELLKESMRFSLQWRDVNLKLPLQSYAALDAHPGPFTILRSLTLSMNTRVWHGDTKIRIQNAPSLREVTLPMYPAIGPDVVWGQLTSLDMSAHFGGEAGILVLKHCSNLIDLKFGRMGQSSTPITIPPCVLPSLKYLTMEGRSLLPFVTVPRLEHLIMSGPGFSQGEIEPLVNSFPALLDRSGPCPLTLLELLVPDMTTIQFRTFLQATTSVVELDLDFHFSTGMDQLITVLQAPDVLPRLTTLRITDASRKAQDALPFDPVLDTLHARRAPGVTGQTILNTFALAVSEPRRYRSYGQPASVRVLPVERFTPLADGGLHVRLAVEDSVVMDT
ncbi:hypothetical protein C8R43DRAFT_1129599 [Mycena crocata]|nr:hypothetical protein C8R43DRAFT_1129599 [Mycena crocata]